MTDLRCHIEGVKERMPEHRPGMRLIASKKRGREEQENRMEFRRRWFSTSG